MASIKLFQFSYASKNLLVDSGFIILVLVLLYYMLSTIVIPKNVKLTPPFLYFLNFNKYHHFIKIEGQFTLLLIN